MSIGKTDDDENQNYRGVDHPGVEAPAANPDGEPESGDVSLSEAMRRLLHSGRELASAEIALGKLRIALLGHAAAWIAALAVLAVIIAFGMIVTLMVGAILALAPHWGLGLAVLAVTGVALLILLACGLGIWSKVRTMTDILR
jgi:hypothetical protein